MHYADSSGPVQNSDRVPWREISCLIGAESFSPTLLEALRASVRYNQAMIESAFRKALASVGAGTRPDAQPPGCFSRPV